MNINKTDFQNLKILLIDKTITYGKFSNKEIVEKLKLNGAVEIERKTAKRQILHLKKESNIFNFLQNNGYIISTLDEIDSYIADILNVSTPRDAIQKWHNDTKAKDSKSLKGLYLSSLKNIDIKLNGESITIFPNNGLGYFLFYTEKVEVNKDTIIVGVENYQVLWFAKKYKKFFENENLLFVVKNSYMLEWIENLENEYIHFGDYDLAGINIYINTIVPRLKKCKKYSMFIPENIEYLIKEHGLPELYEKQKRLKDMVIDDKNILALKDFIIKHKKGLEQEGIINF